MVKDRDWVLCPCRKNRIRATPSTTSFYSNGGCGQTVTQPLKQSVTESALPAAHDEQYVSRDADNGQRLANVHYATTNAGSLHLEIVRNENAQ
ncbi:hypothetical protein [Burkholderia sp. F1]|uniref:hypothetical protein n=1 Tax=Burkholderia sp. F1 TaxID=3366817 RepID=UPI003D75F718